MRIVHTCGAENSDFDPTCRGCGATLSDPPTPRPAEAAPSPSLLGHAIGSYRLVRELGRGGMGVVYEAVHETIARRAAVKVLLGARSHDPRALARFFDEARAVGRLRHPGLVQVYDFGQLPDGTAWLLMELLDGEALRARLDRCLREQRRLPVAEVLRVGRQIAATLAAVHAQGIVHRDLKPENLILVPDPEAPGGERPKVLDFGVARILDAPERRTGDGALVGTLLYMAPEQCAGDGNVDPRADVYALGAMLYEMLAGAPPFLGPAHALLQAHGTHPPPPLRERGAHVPQDVAALVHRMLAKAPRERPDMEEVAAAIRSIEMAPTVDGAIEAGAAERDATAAAVAGRPGSAATPAVPTPAALQPTAAAALEPTARAAPPPASPIAPPPAIGAPARRGALPLGVAGAALLVAATIAAGMRSRSSTKPPATSSARPAAAAPRAMVYIPGAKFTMGSTAVEVDGAFAWCQRLTTGCERALYEREQPPHEVEVAPFYLDADEVTNTEFADWLNRQQGLRLRDEQRIVASDKALLDLYPTYGSAGIAYRDGRYAARRGYERKPVAQATWSAALGYCRSQGKRLPTEAEWELAARGPDGYRFPWGDDEPRCDGVAFGRNRGEACAGLGSGTLEVGQAQQDRSPQGVHDLAGNVAEWVMDRFQMRYPPCAAPCRDPVVTDGPATDGASDVHVVRGGSWFTAAEGCRAAGRSRRKDDAVTGDIGFRCALTTTP